MKDIKRPIKAQIGTLTGLTALLVVLSGSLPQPASAIGAGDADTAFAAYNAAYLVSSGGKTYYTHSLNRRSSDATWNEALSIEGAEDAYERTGTPANQTLVNNLCTTYLAKNPVPWSWDSWNDDIGWAGLVLIRGYQMTNNTAFLKAAEVHFNFSFDRGWDAQSNGGGIWEQQPSMIRSNQSNLKEALSNDSLCQTALMIYQSTGDVTYLNKAKQIYSWVRQTIFDPSNGEVYRGVRKDGTVDKGPALYNQGTFIDTAALLYKITSDKLYLSDAQNAVAFAQDHLMSNGICSNGSSSLATWAAEFARGLGHLVRWNPSLLNTYYAFMTKNADAAWACRRPDNNVAWNAWANPTPETSDVQANWDVCMVAMLQFTPPVNNPLYGTHIIANEQTGQAVDNGGSTAQGAKIVQSDVSGGPAQKWAFTQNPDGTWTIVSAVSGLALEVPGSSKASGAQMVQSDMNGGANQKWRLSVQSDGSYKIWNQYSNKVLAGSPSRVNGQALVQRDWNGKGQERWLLR